MRSMFYNYEHDIDKKIYPPIKLCGCPENSNTFSSAQLLRNAAGKMLGVAATSDTPFTLYFYLDGEVEDGSIVELLDTAKFFLRIYSSKSDELISEILAEAYSDDTVSVQVDPHQYNLNYGTYRLQLMMQYQDRDYELFSKESAILYIE